MFYREDIRQEMRKKTFMKTFSPLITFTCSYGMEVSLDENKFQHATTYQGIAVLTETGRRRQVLGVRNEKIWLDKLRLELVLSPKIKFDTT